MLCFILEDKNLYDIKLTNGKCVIILVVIYTLSAVFRN